MRTMKQKGFAVITLIMAMVLMAALGAGIYSVTTSSTLGNLLAGKDYSAYQLAKAGMRYAALNGSASIDGKYCMGDQCFELKSSTITGGKQYTSRGYVNAGSFLAASRTLAYNVMGFGSSAPINLGGNNPDGTPVFAPVAPTNNPLDTTTPLPPAISPVGTDADGPFVNLGNSAGESFATLPYSGNSTAGGCSAGICCFGSGIRAYFEFKPTTTATNNNGFTFAIWSAPANDNDIRRTGGFTDSLVTGGGLRLIYDHAVRSTNAAPTYTYNVTGTNLIPFLSSPATGELLGYAGPGNTGTAGQVDVVDGLGLKPPKMAIEFSTAARTGTGNVFVENSRKDPSGDHVALVFWGTDPAPAVGDMIRFWNGTYSTTAYKHDYPIASFDDNVHVSPVSGTDYYSKSTGFAYNTTYSVRIEIIRDKTARTYTTYAWIEDQSDSVRANLSDISTAYPTTGGTYSRRINKTVTLASGYNDLFDNIFFGFTAGTSDFEASAENIKLNKFALAFDSLGGCGDGTCPDVVVRTTSLGGTVGVALPALQVVAGGPVTWALTSGTLPPGVTGITASTGAFTGTPTTAGTYTFQATATNTTCSKSVTRTFTVTINPCNPVVISTVSPLPNGLTGVAYPTTLQVSSGGPVTWARPGTGGGTLPPGLTLNPDGSFGGTPLTAGTYTFNVIATSACNATSSLTPFTVTIGCGYTLGSVSYTALDGGTTSTQHVTVTTVGSCQWQAVNNDPTWITRSAPTGTITGPGTVDFTVAANTTGSARNGTMTIAGQTFTVTQGSCGYTISPTSYDAPLGGTTSTQHVSVTTTAGCPWTAASNDSWITRSAPTGIITGSSGTTADFTVAANTSTARIGTLTIAGQTFTVNQGNGCNPTLSSNSASPNSAGGTASFTVTAGVGCTWSAASNTSWITNVTPVGTVTGTGAAVTVSYAVGANTGPARQGTITVAGQTFTVNQLSGCTYSLGSTGASSGSGGGAASFTVTAGTGCTWSAATTYSWLHTSSSGTGNSSAQTVNYSVDANTGPARSGTITVQGQTFTVSQASGCTYSVTGVTGITFAAGVGSDTYTITTNNSACTWSTSDGGDTWVTFTPASGTGSTTTNGAHFDVAANTGIARIANITIAGSPFTVNQASGCNPSISPTTQNFGSAGGSNTVAVTAGTGCTWATTEGLSWVSVTSGSGTGNGTVAYTVDQNTLTSSRSGSLTIGVDTFTVDQARACSGYGVYNNIGTRYDFRVTGGSCQGNVSGSGGTITTNGLNSGDTVSRYTRNSNCGTYLGQITYSDALYANTDNNCDVNYDAGDTVSNH